MLIIGIRTEGLQVEVSLSTTKSADTTRSAAIDSALFEVDSNMASFLDRRVPVYPNHRDLLVVRDLEGKETAIETIADWNVRRAHIVSAVEEVMGKLPGGERRTPLQARVEATIDEPSYTRKKITFASEPGDRVPAWLLTPRRTNDSAKLPALLCAHQTVAIGKDEPVGLGGKTSLHYGKEAVERGYVVLAIDYPNFGDHRVNPYEMGYASASMKAIWDAMRGIDYLESLIEVDPMRIGMMGHSLGGHHAIFTAVFDSRIAAIVSSCGYTAFPWYMKGNLAGWSHSGYMPRIRSRFGLEPSAVPFDFPELIAALAPRPFFTNAPLHDANFEVSGVKECVAAAAAVYKLFHADDRLATVHPDCEHDFPDSVRERAFNFLETRLNHPAEKPRISRE